MNRSQRRRIAARAATHGFTLVELLIVVAMIGIMAALAMLGYRRYLNTAHSAEAKTVISMIRNGQEAYKAEMLQYLKVSSSIGEWYPNTTFDGKASSWVVSGTVGDRWKMLNVNPDGPVRFRYVCVAGTTPADSFQLPNVFSVAPSMASTLPSGTTWYMVQAKSDNDGNGKFAVFASTSLSGEIMSENEQE